ncbi:protein-disulfide isomerase [Arcanobacterium wilhelmae]|uniref:Protein-disulfide isomerase n=1 Tax=Arcanobacterium wilhelmae TaxID=1803177 RepID=A0ABT9NAS6_9ACTO|nr:thioredoxin domain-containing protein [Arcanobacterium wilhelmae]MDP9800827.1 protein-disulfide isomerase [Arcanobacterium wilhelmae]WFN90202.1 thioredoxin domain-containing protein [Arcanobacterium wilhelmae]
MSEPNQNTFPPQRELEDDAVAQGAVPNMPASRTSRTPKTGRNVMIALISVLTVVVIAFVVMLFAWKGGADKPQMMSSQAASASAGAQASASAGAQDFQPVEQSAEAKKLIASQQRREEGDPMALGKVDAPVVMSVYSDYMCPHCQDFNVNTLPKLQKWVDDGVLRIEYNELPILGEKSNLAAQAAYAAANQGKFWEFHKAIFGAWANGRPDYTPETLTAFAKEAGVADLEKFATDLTAKETVAKREAGYDLGIKKLGFQFVPSVLVGDQFLDKPYPVETIGKIIQGEAEKKGAM